MKALVTGASGFVGLHLISHLQEKGDEVLAAYFPEKGHEPGCQWVELNVCDSEACSRVISSCQPDVVYHLAGVAFGPDAEKNFSQALSINAGGTFNIYKAAADSGRAIKIVLVSSGEIYGRISEKELPITESTSIKPANSYALSKLMSEQVPLRFLASQNLKSVIMRPFNHFGPGQRGEFVISSFARQLAMISTGQQAPVMEVGNLEARRDFSHVSDVVRAYRLAALNGQGVYNLCAGVSVSVQSLLDHLIEISGVKVEVRRDPARMRAAEVPLVSASCEKARIELGWQPEHNDLRSSLAEVYRYWLEKCVSAGHQL